MFGRLLLIALGLFLFFAIRRALAAGKVQRRRPVLRPKARREPKDRKERKQPVGHLPERIVCGACGNPFDPNASSWICPSCGK